MARNNKAHGSDPWAYASERNARLILPAGAVVRPAIPTVPAIPRGVAAPAPPRRVDPARPGVMAPEVGVIAPTSPAISPPRVAAPAVPRRSAPPVVVPIPGVPAPDRRVPGRAGPAPTIGPSP